MATINIKRQLMDNLMNLMEGSKNIKVRCPSTIKSYCKSVRTVANKIDAYIKEGDDTLFDYSKLSNIELVLDAIKSVKKSTQKSYLEGLVAIFTFKDEKLYKTAINTILIGKRRKLTGKRSIQLIRIMYYLISKRANGWI